MDIRYIKNKNIDKTKWDHCIENSFNGTLYAMSWYLDVASDYWDALVVGDYEIVFPITYTKKFGFKILRQPVGSQQLGIFSKKPLSQDEMIEFLEAIPKSFLFGSLHLNAGNKITYTKKFPVKYNVNIELDVRDSIEIIRKNYIRNNKRNIAKARNNGIRIERGTDFDRITATFKSNLGDSRYNVHPNVYKVANELFAVLEKKGLLIIYDAYSNNTFLAGIVLVPYKNRMIAIFSGCSNEGYQISASHFLFDYAIGEASKNKEIFDFEGSNTESLAFVFHGFGGKTVPYPVVTITNVPKIFVKMFYFLRKIKG